MDALQCPGIIRITLRDALKNRGIEGNSLILCHSQVNPDPAMAAIAWAKGIHGTPSGRQVKENSVIDYAVGNYIGARELGH